MKLQKKETPAKVFSSKQCEILMNTFYRTLIGDCFCTLKDVPFYSLEGFTFVFVLELLSRSTNTYSNKNNYLVNTIVSCYVIWVLMANCQSRNIISLCQYHHLNEVISYKLYEIVFEKMAYFSTNENYRSNHLLVILLTNLYIFKN